jgi:3,4-dihydroxyphenylacetate 2,3-dioxygenase
MAAQQPAFLTELIAGAKQMGERVREARPDVLVLQSAHWLTTFHWYVTCQASHEGMCVATEAPDLIPGIAYARQGDPALAGAIVEAAAEPLGATRGRCLRNETEHFLWDYGSLVPLLTMDPQGGLPVVLLSTCMAATLEECRTMGAALRKAAKQAGRRALFVASGALSHELTRSPDDWPTPERQEMDHRFATLLTEGRIDEALAWLPRFAKDAVAEVGGRHIATLLGALAGNGPLRGEAFGYAQSSGSGNANVLILPSA